MKYLDVPLSYLYLCEYEFFFLIDPINAPATDAPTAGSFRRTCFKNVTSDELILKKSDSKSEIITMKAAKISPQGRKPSPETFVLMSPPMSEDRAAAAIERVNTREFGSGFAYAITEKANVNSTKANKYTISPIDAPLIIDKIGGVSFFSLLDFESLTEDRDNVGMRDFEFLD